MAYMKKPSIKAPAPKRIAPKTKMPKVKKFSEGGYTDTEDYKNLMSAAARESAEFKKEVEARKQASRAMRDVDERDLREEAIKTRTKASSPASEGSFGSAFAAARKAGKGTFTWKGKSYSTEMAGEKKKKASAPAATKAAEPVVRTPAKAPAKTTAEYLASGKGSRTTLTPGREVDEKVKRAMERASGKKKEKEAPKAVKKDIDDFTMLAAARGALVTKKKKAKK